MGLLKHFRSRSRLSSGPQSTSQHPSTTPPTPYRGRDHISRLPEKVLARIFGYVCPHSQDFSYEPSERSQIGDGCMLCDLRDLSHCAAVCRKWYRVAQTALYGSVRIDAVHYCALEEELAERRRKAGKHFRSKSTVLEAGEVPNVRLALLCRTVREQAVLAEKVLVFKLPYMTRETAKGDLARTVSALPNLRYVDLPDGFFTGEHSCLALRQELQARCPDVRKMAYRAGSEESLELLAQRHWQMMESLELDGLAIELGTLRIVLSSLPMLADLTLSNMDWMDDDVFQPSPGQLPDFPPVRTLKIENTRHVTAAGLQQYLEVPSNREQLTSLTLVNTSVSVTDLPSVLWVASSLEHLSLTATVSKSLGLASSQNLPPLTSLSLRTLHFEITSAEDVHSIQKPAESHYAYLASSLHANALPGLTALYVRDPDFPELLLLPPVPTQVFAGSEAPSLRSKLSNLSVSPSSASQRQSQQQPNKQRPVGGGGFTQQLEVFSKGLDELEWVFTSISPPSPILNGHFQPNRRESGRPLSAYSASRGLGPQWAQGGFGGEARKSVIVGNGFGGFLAVPQEEVPRPMTSDGHGGNQIDGVGGTRWGSMTSQATAGSAGSGFLKPPPSLSSLAGSHTSTQERRGSRHDLWR